MSSNQFPDGFLWGCATAAYQIEGAVRDGGRGASVWDVFSHAPGKVYKGDTGDVACDHYHRYKDDVKLIRDLGFGSYRFSLSWPRIVPNGKGQVNAAGLDFYQHLVDALLEQGIQPAVTLFHWDYPQVLHEAGGWQSKDGPHWFADFAEIAFSKLGDRCKFWMTLNEPWCYAWLGHGSGVHAPGIKDETTAFAVGHGLLLGHGYAVERFRSIIPDGRIGLVTNHTISRPYSDSAADIAANERSNAFSAGWFLDPVYKGDYPALLKERFKLPEFTSEEAKLVSAKTDFMGFNYYFCSPVREKIGAFNDAEPVEPEGERTATGWPVTTDELRYNLVETQRIYNPDVIYVTENGTSTEDATVEAAVQDDFRCRYLHGHIASCKKAVDEGVRLGGYFVWSLLDNFEWAEGYRPRFGIVHVDFETQVRTPKNSAKMLARFIQSNAVVD